MSYTETHEEIKHFCDTCGELWAVSTWKEGMLASDTTRFHMCQCKEDHLAKVREMLKQFWIAWDRKQDETLLKIFKEQNNIVD